MLSILCSVLFTSVSSKTLCEKDSIEQKIFMEDAQNLIAQGIESHAKNPVSLKWLSCTDCQSRSMESYILKSGEKFYTDILLNAPFYKKDANCSEILMDLLEKYTWNFYVRAASFSGHLTCIYEAHTEDEKGCHHTMAILKKETE